MISASELAQIQADAAAITCNFPCTIQRKTTSKDQYGGETDTWAVVEITTCGLSEPTAGQLQNYDFLIGSLAAWQVKLPYGTNVQHQDQILVTGEFAQQTLEVHVVLEPRSYAALLTVLAAEVK